MQLFVIIGLQDLLNRGVKMLATITVRVITYNRGSGHPYDEIHRSNRSGA